MEKKIDFYETDLVTLVKKIAREEIVTAPTFQTFLKEGRTSEVKSILNSFPDMSLGCDGLSSGKAY